MKNLLILLGVFCALNANAQDYDISFTGSGSSSSVSIVKVENLTSGTSLVMNGGYVLHLTSITTGVNSAKNEPFSQIKIYPNPMTDYTTVQICPPVAGEAVFTVFDITGKTIARERFNLDNSRQDFRLSGLKSGLYLINVTGTNYQFSEKLISICEANGPITIEKVNNTAQIVDKKTEEEKVSKGVQGTVDMLYTPWDRLKFTGTSGNYSTVWIDIPTSDKTITFDFMPCVDGDNNNYPVVEIGTQVWMAENLKTTRYRNGDFIETSTPATKNLLSEVTPIYQWAYGGNEDNVLAFGRLYTWHTLAGNSICPTGWHVPTDADWATLADYLGGSVISGDKLKDVGNIHWNAPGTCATNETGFTALPGGYRFSTGGFEGLGNNGIWWSLTEDNLNEVWARGISANGGDLYESNNSKRFGYSVRCLKGEVLLLPVLSTKTVSSVTLNTAVSGGNVRSDGGAAITARGVCWSTSPDPTIENNKTLNGTGSGSFTSPMTGLTANTSYYVRAYATNSIGTAYGNEVFLKTYTGTVTDIDGNVYNTVTMGTQVWFVENLKTTRYRNGDLIGTTTPATLDISGESTPKYQWPNNGDESNVNTYGRLYTWNALIDNRNVCPIGWHVPNFAEWGNIGSSVKSLAATTDWITNAIPGTIGYDLTINNSSGFTALPGGKRTKTFGSNGGAAWWWSLGNNLHPEQDNRMRIDNNNTSPETSNSSSYEGLAVRCLKGEVQLLPIIITTVVSSITLYTAISGGNVTYDWGVPITARGVCWSTSANPDIFSNKTIDGTGTGTFVSSITGLTPGTTYHVRAYATNSLGTAYGNEISFTTNPEALLALTTAAVNNIGLSTALSGGNVTSDGGSAIIARGICWSTTPSPNISNNKTTDGIGTGTFTSSITGLTSNTSYYVRAYATNSLGTSYGNELIFKTFTGSVTDIDGNVYNTVTIGTQLWIAENLKTTKYNDNSDISLLADFASWHSQTPGYCWYDNDINNKNIYGAIYNVRSVRTNKLCPVGWNVPSRDQWNILISFLGGESLVGSKLKETGTVHWQSPNTGATNESGFTALPGGLRHIIASGSFFVEMGTYSNWWSSDEWIFFITNTSTKISTLNSGYWDYVGTSVRCIKDN